MILIYNVCGGIMKKNILLILGMTLILIGCLSLLLPKLLVPKTYKEINYKTLVNKLDKQEDFVLFIGSEQCSHCQKYKKTINRVVEDYKIKVYYIDILKLTEEENAYISAHFPYSGTPTTLVIKNGIEYERQACRIEGAKDYDYTVKRLKKAGIIKG